MAQVCNADLSWDFKHLPYLLLCLDLSNANRILMMNITIPCMLFIYSFFRTMQHPLKKQRNKVCRLSPSITILR